MVSDHDSWEKRFHYFFLCIFTRETSHSILTLSVPVLLKFLLSDLLPPLCTSLSYNGTIFTHQPRTALRLERTPKVLKLQYP